jgi:hypothetical protein
VTRGRAALPSSVLRPTELSSRASVRLYLLPFFYSWFLSISLGFSLSLSFCRQILTVPLEKFTGDGSLHGSGVSDLDYIGWPIFLDDTWGGADEDRVRLYLG